MILTHGFEPFEGGRSEYYYYLYQLVNKQNDWMQYSACLNQLILPLHDLQSLIVRVITLQHVAQ